MKWNVSIDGRWSELEVVRDGDAWKIRKNGQENKASVIEVEPSVYSVLIGDRSYEARIQGGWVDLGRRHIAVEVQDPRVLRSASSSASAHGRKNVSASMPGKVIRLLVQEGDTVEAGQGLVVVEAMKMQNEMKSPKAGQVVRLSAHVGATVAAGEVLVVIA